MLFISLSITCRSSCRPVSGDTLALVCAIEPTECDVAEVGPAEGEAYAPYECAGEHILSEEDNLSYSLGVELLRESSVGG